MITAPINRYTIDQARAHLTSWMIRKAAAVARDVGFSYQPVAHGNPETYGDVLAQYATSRRDRVPYRVWSGASDNTIYTCPEGNYAFRFVHDVYHAAFGHGFDIEGEVAVAHRHINEVAREHGGHDSLEARLMYVDTAGQLAYGQANGGAFVEDQLAFAYSELEGIAKELGLLEEVAA